MKKPNSYNRSRHTKSNPSVWSILKTFKHLKTQRTKRKNSKRKTKRLKKITQMISSKNNLNNLNHNKLNHNNKSHLNSHLHNKSLTTLPHPMKTSNSFHKYKMVSHNCFNPSIRKSYNYKKSLNKSGIQLFWNGKMLKSTLITKSSLKLSTWVMLALLISTLLKVFKQESIVHLKSFLDILMFITLMFGLWLVQFLNLWQTISFLNLKRLKEFPKMKITCIKCCKYWVQWVNSLHWEEQRVQHISTRRVN